MIAKPDRFAVRLGEKITLRATAEGRLLLAEGLTIEELRDTVTELARGLTILHDVTLVALDTVIGSETPNGDCTCPDCNLIRLRDSLAGPTLQ